MDFHCLTLITVIPCSYLLMKDTNFSYFSMINCLFAFCLTFKDEKHQFYIMIQSIPHSKHTLLWL